MGNRSRVGAQTKTDWRTDRRPHDIYRLYDAYGRLLYVGITNRSGMDRFVEHSRDKAWWDQVQRIHVEHLVCTRALAEQYEAEAIKHEKPLFNVMHNGMPQQPKQPATPVLQLEVMDLVVDTAGCRGTVVNVWRDPNTGEECCEVDFHHLTDHQPGRIYRMADVRRCLTRVGRYPVDPDTGRSLLGGAARRHQ